jgi:hypothetical protein
VFPVRYELNFYIVFGRNSVFKGLTMDGSHFRRRRESPSHYFTRLKARMNGRSWADHYLNTIWEHQGGLERQACNNTTS